MKDWIIQMKTHPKPDQDVDEEERRKESGRSVEDQEFEEQERAKYTVSDEDKGAVQGERRPGQVTPFGSRGSDTGARSSDEMHRGSDSGEQKRRGRGSNLTRETRAKGGRHSAAQQQRDAQGQFAGKKRHQSSGG